MGITSRSDLHAYWAADLEHLGLKRWHWHYRITGRPYYYQRLLRLTEYRLNTARTPFARIIAKATNVRLVRLGELLGVSIHPNSFGPGLSIAHVGQIVVNPEARIGARCRIHQGVTIGSVAGVAPVIGDDTWIGPSATLFGGVVVGDGAAVGANSVVNKDVPAGVTVAGAPARVIRERGY